MLQSLKNIFKKKSPYKDIDPDEIFLDSQNLPDFNVDQFEGRIEKPISVKTFVILGFVLACIGITCLARVWYLQVTSGSIYRTKSETNRLKTVTLFANRGVISDRNGEQLAWNDINPEGDDFTIRKYASEIGLSTVLGYVKYPAKDKSGNYYEKNFIPVDGIEKNYNTQLSGENGTRLTETDVAGHITSQSVLVPAQDGDNITLSIDKNIQTKLYQSMIDYSQRAGYQGGSGVIMNVYTGELIAMANFPEYDSNVMADGSDSEKIQGYLSNKNNPFLNRAVAGLYTPGSIMKPYVAIGALTEHTIDPTKIIVSTGSISVPNPYDPSHPSIFKDWKILGPVDMRRALAMSSDVYFYEVGGGFQNPGGSYQQGLGITNIEKYERLFGFGAKTGVAVPGEAIGVTPDPTWKLTNFNGEAWRIGDTYHTAIGQYGVQITPLQAVRAVAAIANSGNLVTPQLLHATSTDAVVFQQTGIDPSYLQIVKEGMRMAVTAGTVQSLNVSYVQVSAKSGTAQIGVSKDSVNSWVIGFFPSDHPRYAFALVMERGPATETLGASLVMRPVFDYMNINEPQYFK